MLLDKSKFGYNFDVEMCIYKRFSAIGRLITGVSILSVTLVCGLLAVVTVTLYQVRDGIPSNRPVRSKPELGFLPENVTQKATENSLKAEYGVTVPTRDGPQARFLVTNISNEKVLLDWNRHSRGVMCTLREYNKTALVKYSSMLCEIDRPFLMPGPNSYSTLAVHVENISDELEVTFSYYVGDDLTPQQMTVKTVEQDYSNLGR